MTDMTKVVWNPERDEEVLGAPLRVREYPS